LNIEALILGGLLIEEDTLIQNPSEICSILNQITAYMG
jgi:hypothetical protein